MNKVTKRGKRPSSRAIETEEVEVNGQRFVIAPLTVRQVNELVQLPRTSTQEIKAFGLRLITDSLNNAGKSHHTPDAIATLIDLQEPAIGCDYAAVLAGMRTYAHLCVRVLDLTGLESSGFAAMMAQLETGAATQSLKHVN